MHTFSGSECSLTKAKTHINKAIRHITFTMGFGLNVNTVVDLMIPPQADEEEEAESFNVCLTKNAQGLGITIAGYVGDKNSGEGSKYTFKDTCSKLNSSHADILVNPLLWLI